MIRVSFTAHNRDPIEGKTRSWYKTVDRPWSQVPGINEIVAMHDPDALLEPVVGVTWTDVGATLHFVTQLAPETLTAADFIVNPMVD